MINTLQMKECGNASETNLGTRANKHLQIKGAFQIYMIWKSTVRNGS